MAIAAGGGGVGGTAGTEEPPVSLCSPVTDIEGPSPSAECRVITRTIDPAFTCEGADCAITKALDLTCDRYAGQPWLAAAADGATLEVVTVDNDGGKTLAHLMTVTGANARVENIPPFVDSGGTSGDSSVQNSALSTTADGARWLFGGSAPDIVAFRETETGWKKMYAVAASEPSNYAYLTDAHIIDDRQGYLTYSTDNAHSAHLVTWDGSCWTDQSLGKIDPMQLVVEVDAQNRPWVAWFTAEDEQAWFLYLRAPSGDKQSLLAKASAERKNRRPLRLLPGGLDGTAAFPMVAATFSDGIRVFSNAPTSDSGWDFLVLPETAQNTTTGDCPPDSGPEHPCLGLTSCTAQASGASSGFGLVRTDAGATFAAWVVYSSEGSYSLEEVRSGGQVPRDHCIRTETSGSGTADLVVARLTDSEPVLTRFHFDTGSAVGYLAREVEMATRGDTLLVAAYLSGAKALTLTYLELDSKLLQ